MTFQLSTPINGATQTGFTSPTYTLTDDQSPDIGGRQVAITALGGTQSGVTVHSGSSPFTINMVRAKNFKILPMPDVNGIIRNIPVNVTSLKSRKGVTCYSGGQPRLAMVHTDVSIPAGADTYDAANIRGMLSAHIGALIQLPAGFGDSVVSQII